VTEIQNPALENYLRSRALPIDLARLYFSEAVYRYEEREYRALAFANDAGGYEIRSPSFKGTLGSKALRFIPSTTVRGDAVVFEGAMDFISALAHYKRDRSDANVLVLNSTALTERGMLRLQEDGVHTALTYFDHDTAGRIATERFTNEGPDHGVRITRDMSALYAGHEDFNDFLMARQMEQCKGGLRGRQLEDDLER
jgi:hypothetical protein